jgi:hypothetical protein
MKIDSQVKPNAESETLGPKPNETPTGRDRAFFLSMACAAGMTVFLGFAQSYYLRSITHATHYPTGIPISTVLHPLIHTHALMFSAWMLLFIAQNALVATGRIHLHRRLGIMGGVLIPFITVLGFLTAVRGAKDGWNPGGPFADSQAFMVVGFGDILVFFGFAAAGLFYRQYPAIHKRLMLLATVGGLMWPAITRMPYVAGRPALMFGLLAALVLAPAVYDRLSYTRFHPVSLWGGLLVLAAFPLRGLVGRTTVWHSFAAWLLR